MRKLLPSIIVLGLLLTSCGSQTPLQTIETTGTSQSYPLYFATMTHMEGGFKDDTNQDLFNLHVDQLRYGMDLAEQYDAILTIESEKPFAEGSSTWGVNILQEVLDRGHGVGTHCDLGFSSAKKGKELTVDQLAQQMEENKALVDDLVGAENNHGCSGAGSTTDWVAAAQTAGFDYINGIVGMHLLAIPQENRPDPTWTTEYILSGGYHDSVPTELMDRIYLMKLADLADFEADKTGIVISNGELGLLDNQSDAQTCATDCPLTNADVDALVETIKSVNEQRDPTRVAKLTTYLPVNIFDSKNEDTLQYFFSELQKLQKDGIIEWSSQWDIVKTYLDANP